VPLWEEYNKVRRKSQVVGGLLEHGRTVVGIKQSEKENRDRFNGSPHLLLFTAKRRIEKILKDPPHPVLIVVG
jgi:hypothetical protein